MTRHFTAEGTIRESQISPLSCGVRRLFILMDIQAIKIDLMSKNWFIQEKAMNLYRAIQNKDHPALIKYAEQQWLQAKADEKARGTTVSRNEFEKQQIQPWIDAQERIRKLTKLMVTKGKGKISKKDALQKAKQAILQRKKLQETIRNYQPSPDHLKVSRKEEHQAVAFIKRVGIPHAVEVWNKNSPQHWQVTAEQLNKALKKFDISSGPGGDIIIYTVNFKVPGTAKHQFIFRIYKSDLINRLTVELVSNLHKFGDRKWDV